MPIHREQRIQIEDPAILARYLPAVVANYLLDSEGDPPPAVDLNAHIARLQELLQIVVSYVPNHVALMQPAQPAARLGHVSCTSSTLLSADLSGFTAFSARLSTLGSEGAELVAHTISGLFSALIGVLASWDGSLLKLSGDALTVLFSGSSHGQRAVAAALELQACMGAFQELTTPAGTFSLQMRIGAASGDVLLAEVGTPDRIELLVGGVPARRAVEFQRQAAPGAVVVDGGVYRALAPGSQVLTVASGMYRVLASNAPLPEPRLPMNWLLRRDLPWELHALIIRLETLRPYLVDQHLTRLASGAPTLVGEGDLRPVTVLFAHLSDCSPLLERAIVKTRDESPATNLEESGLRTVPPVDQSPIVDIQAGIQRIWEIVARYGGTINKIDLYPTGHTLMVLFGAPVAQGRDAERAVSCALALLEEASSAGTAGTPAIQRIGIASGRVFAGAVGALERREYTVMGSVVNLAARLMDIAQPRQVLIDATSAAVISRRFELLALPSMPVKGYDEPIPLYEVVAQQRGPLTELLHERGPLIGRHAELNMAQVAVEHALSGRGAVVELAGEAGIGKSRLLAEIVRSSLATPKLAMPGPVIVLAQPHAHSRGRPYAVVADVLRRIYDFPDQPDQVAQAVSAHVSDQIPTYVRFLPLLLAVLGLPSVENAITQVLTLDERRVRLHDLLVALLTSHAHERPLALVLEDLHWSDAASIDVLGDLAAACRELPMVVLCTCRPDERPHWPAKAEIVRIAIEGLPDDQSQSLLRERLDGLTLPDGVYAAVLKRTQGNPFFIEETARVLRERGGNTSDTLPLPSTVQGALLVRLDRLRAEERYMLQVASVIGARVAESFLDMLLAGQLAVRQTLRQLVAHGLLRPESASERYTFTHSLTQETAYESLLFAQRRELHRRVADLLRADDPQRADEEPGLLAFHYRRAEDWEQTLEFAVRAGARAQSLYAGDLALSDYRQAIEAIDHLDSPEATRRRSAILRRCGDIQALAGQYTEAITAFEAALAASEDRHEHAEILIGWAEVCEQQAAYDEALTLLDRAAATLAGSPDDPLVLRIDVRRGYVLVRQGALEQAQAAIEHCLERLEEQKHWLDLLLAYRIFFLIALGQSRWSKARAYLRLALGCAERINDMREIARIHNNLGAVLGLEGDLRAAAQSFEHAARAMEEIGDQYNLASVKVNTGVIYYKLGDFPTALEYYNASLQIAVAIGALPIEGIAHNNLGEIYRGLGRLPESLDQLQRSVELCRQLHDDLGLSEAYRQLAETYIMLGRLDEAAEACEHARDFAIAAGDLQAEAIAYRARGLLAVALADYDGALAVLADSVRLLTGLGSAHELGQSMIVQVKTLIRLGQTKTAHAFLEEATRLLRQAGAASDLAQAQQLFADIEALAALEELQS
jgi:class 3 adenylate cyclase/tetratricopeptide (TPR) repeat protein